MGDASGRQRLGTRWIDRSMRAKGLVAIAVPIAILVVVLGSTFWFTHVDNRAQDIAGNARQIVDVATMLENSVLSAQADLGGYLLTSNPSFHTSSAAAQRSVPAHLGELEALTLDTPQGQRRGPAIQRDTNRLLSSLDRLDRLPPSAARSASAISLLGSVQAQTDRLRGDISSLSNQETALIDSQQSAVHTSSVFLPAIAIAAVALALSGGVIVSQLFTSGVVTRLRRLERATEAVERGETPGEVPRGRDEIGRLSARLLDTTSQLRERAEERDRARGELENILTASPVVSLRYDVATRCFSYASPNIDRLLGISAEVAMAEPGVVIDHFHPDSAHALRDALVGGTVRHGERLEILLRFRRDPSSHDWREAEAVYIVESGPAGELQGLVAYLVDVSERHVAQRAAEERRFLLESIFHASPDTIVVRDISGQVVLASSALAEVIGTTDTVPDARADTVTLDELSVDNVAPHTDRAILERLIARCVAGEQSPDPVVSTGRLPDGDLRTYETRARPVFDHWGHVTGTVTISRDITERMRLEQSLRHASVGAERASQAKSEFLSRMSHELRTPLNAILGFAQLLELDDLPEDQAASIDQIQVAGRHLLSLINEVLDISRIEAGQVSLSTEPVDVGDVLDEVTTLLAPVAEAADIVLSVDSGGGRVAPVHADRQRLVQVLLNLGSNAVKYNSRGGSVAFSTGTGANGRVRLEVRDTGPGIAREQQDQLFVPFSRLGAERSAVEGTGVGLALSKQLVELMVGSIGVESVPGHGSTFWIELLPVETAVAAELPDPHGAAWGGDPPPGVRAVHGMSGTARRAAPEPRPRSEPNGTGTPRASGRGVVVLQIEDNASNAALVEQVLAKRPGVRLVSAIEGRSGLELARQHRPDLVLLDLHLPDLPGDELLHRLKAVPELADTKVVVVSADATPSRIREMLDLGVEGYLTKPVDVEALLRLVDYEIGAKQGEPR